MSEIDAEIQLKVWKELAISKQVLMNAAIEALKIEKDCTAEELKQAIEATIKRCTEAELEVGRTKEQARLELEAVEQKLAESQRALDEVEASLSEARANEQKLEQQVINVRADNERQLKNLKESLAEKERAIKAINTTLSDTPENVVKKLKTLRKQKMDEADARKKATEALSALRKDKQLLEKSLKELQAQDKPEDKPEEQQAA